MMTTRWLEYAGLAGALAIGLVASYAHAEGRYLQISRVEAYLSPLRTGDGQCATALTVDTVEQGEIHLRFDDNSNDCENLFDWVYSYEVPPALIAADMHVLVKHSLKALTIEGAGVKTADGSVWSGCKYATDRVIDDVSIENNRRYDETSWELTFSPACKEGELFVISYSAGQCFGKGRCAGFDYYYLVMAGTPPQADAGASTPGDDIVVHGPPAIVPDPVDQVDDEDVAGRASGPTAEHPFVDSDGIINDGRAIWKPEGPVQTVALTTLSAVQNGPTRPAVFNTSKTMVLDAIMTYHWNSGRGAPVGTIALKDEAGKRLGPWEAKGSDGQGGVYSAYWHVRPDIILPPGQYEIIDSNPETWATNGEVHGRGIFEAKLRKVVQVGSVLP